MFFTYIFQGIELVGDNECETTTCSHTQTQTTYSCFDALLSPLLDPLEGLSMLNCEKLGLEGRSQLPALKEGRGAC
jgi:hypothetical protein